MYMTLEQEHLTMLGSLAVVMSILNTSISLHFSAESTSFISHSATALSQVAHYASRNANSADCLLT